MVYRVALIEEGSLWVMYLPSFLCVDLSLCTDHILVYKHVEASTIPARTPIPFVGWFLTPYSVCVFIGFAKAKTSVALYTYSWLRV